MINRFTLVFSLGALASISIHAVVLTVLVVGLPQFKPAQEEPEAIEVEVVSPKEEVQKEQKARPKSEPKRDLSEIAPRRQEHEKQSQRLRPVHKFDEKDASSDNLVNEGSAAKDMASGGSSTRAGAGKQAIHNQTTIRSETPTPESEPISAPVNESSENTEVTQNSLSQANNVGSIATTAIGDLARGIRAGELCATELRGQLRNSIPSFWPDLIPTYRLDEGNILQVHKGAFRANARWYNLKFRCEIDGAATEVIAFEFEVGPPVPRTEWANRGFPAF